MSRLLRFSRWRRLPGAHRVFEKRLPTHAETLQRFTVYLPGQTLEHAENLARLEGVAHAQAYCEGILNGVIEAEVARRRVDATPPTTPTDEEIEDQAANLSRDQDARAGPRAFFSLRLIETHTSGDGNGGSDDPQRLALPPPVVPEVVNPGPVVRSEPSEAAARVVSHAGSEGFLESLRRGQPPSARVVDELMEALSQVERELGPGFAVDRRLAHALFRLAFESQVLITDAWPRLGEDPVTLSAARRVQEAAESTLSGVDVRYDRLAYRSGGAPS